MSAAYTGLPLPLPLELSAMVREHLDIYDLLTCVRVCKAWKDYLLSEGSIHAMVKNYEVQGRATCGLLGLEDAFARLELIKAHHTAPTLTPFRGVCGYNRPKLAGKWLICFIEELSLLEVTNLATGTTCHMVAPGPVLAFAMTETHYVYAYNDLLAHEDVIVVGIPGEAPELHNWPPRAYGSHTVAVAGRGSSFVAARRFDAGYAFLHDGVEVVEFEYPGSHHAVHLGEHITFLAVESGDFTGVSIMDEKNVWHFEHGCEEPCEAHILETGDGLLFDLKSHVLFGEEHFDLPMHAAVWRNRSFYPHEGKLRSLPWRTTGPAYEFGKAGRCVVNDDFLVVYSEEFQVYSFARSGQRERVVWEPPQPSRWVTDDPFDESVSARHGESETDED